MPRDDGGSDDMIREVLDEADEGFADPSAAELLTETFRGRNRRLAIAGVIGNVVLLVVTIFSGIRFFRAEDARQTAFWGICTLLALGLLISVKIWYWLEMNRLALVRDIKRVELRVAEISERIE